MFLQFAIALSATFSGTPTLQTTLIPGVGPEEVLALHCIHPARKGSQAVLFIHGSTFPTRAAFGFEFAPGDSWMQFVAKQGFLTCGIDFAGFGQSSLPADMKGAASANAPSTRSPKAAAEIARAVSHLSREMGATSIHLVAHSWGTIPAAQFAASHPHAIESLTLFGPLVPSGSQTPETPSQDAWFHLTPAQRLDQLRFKSVLPAGKVLLDPAVESRWAAAFRDSMPHLESDGKDRIRVSNGPNLDVGEAMSGKYPFAFKDIVVPVFVVYGNHDVVVDDTQAADFLARFSSSPLKWKLQISDASHVMHLEKERRSLFESVSAFIRAVQQKDRPSGTQAPTN
ncbi:MAG: alpha/beta fold hydrolase [Rhodanobacteraceae bacterium]|nr:alpha/beta fold hydrolase [Rhodanobacteraceae bacterium]